MGTYREKLMRCLASKSETVLEDAVGYLIYNFFFLMRTCAIVPYLINVLIYFLIAVQYT